MKMIKSVKFTSITIVIESETEAEMLWHKLNMGDFGNYTGLSTRDRLDLGRVGDSAWRQFNEMFKSKIYIED